MTLKSLMIIAMLSSIAVPASALTQAEIKQCNAMAASFSAKKAELTKAKKALEEKAAATELAGEEWEAAEQEKLFSSEAAQKASDTKAHWTTLKSEFAKDQMALQSKLQMLNTDVAAYNQKCATK